MKPTIAVLITCHNRKDKTIQCLEALFAQKGLDVNYIINVFLVDDGSTDGTAEAITSQFSDVNIISGDGNLFWNRGMHLAWKNAVKTKDFDYYLWLNDDTLLFHNALNILTEGFTTLGNKNIYVGATASEINTEITYSGYKLNKTLLKPNGKWQICDYFNGNIVLIPRYVFEKVGMNDALFRHALGDFDYGLRAKKNGIELYIAPELLGYCETHDRLPKWCNKETKFTNRIIELYKPLGNNPFEFFIFDSRHNGFLTAIKHFITIHLRVFSPNIWSNLK